METPRFISSTRIDPIKVLRSTYATLFTFGAPILLAVAFVTPFWLECETIPNQHFKRSHLREACLERLHDYHYRNDRLISACKLILDENYASLIDSPEPNASNLVTRAFKQYATPGTLVTLELCGAGRTSEREKLTKLLAKIEGNLMLGSSLLAAAIPLAMLVLPTDLRARRDTKDPDTSEGLAAGLLLPAAAATSSQKFTTQSRVDSVMGWIERSVEHLPNFPRLHPQECAKRSICEAHNEPNKYGAIGFVLRVFFPATNLSITDTMDDMEFKVINKYRYAAGYGLNKRIDNNGTSSAACKEKYEDCLVSLLDVAQNLIDIFLK